MIAHGARRGVNSGLQNLRSLCVLSKIANYDQSRTLPNPMRRFDQPMIDHVAEAVPVSNPESVLSVIPLVHGSHRAIEMNFTLPY
jgi:hypothetical protein